MLLEGVVYYDRVLLAKLLAFALPHSVLQVLGLEFLLLLLLLLLPERPLPFYLKAAFKTHC